MSSSVVGGVPPPLKARFPVDPQLLAKAKGGRPATAQAARPTTAHQRPTTAAMRQREQQPPVPTDPSGEYQLDIDALRSSRPSASAGGETSYRHTVDPNRTRAGERAAATVSLLIPGNTLRPSTGFGRIHLKSSIRARPQTARLHSSVDTERHLMERHPSVKAFVGVEQRDPTHQGLKESPSAQRLLKRPGTSGGLTSPRQSTKPSTTTASSSPSSSSIPWHALYGFACEPHFRFVNLQATNNVISSGGLVNNSNIQLCFLLSTSGFARQPTQEEEAAARLAEEEEGDDPEEEIVEYVNASGQAVRFKKSPRRRADSSADDPPPPRARLRRQKFATEPVEPAITLTFQTHLPPLFSLVDDTHYPADGSACPSRAGLVHALALQYERLFDSSRVKVGDIRLLRFSLESLLYSLEHFDAYLTRMDWTLHYIAISMKGPLLVFIGSYRDVHVIVAASARMGMEVEDEERKHHRRTTDAPQPPPAPSAWLVQKSKLYILHLPRDLALGALRLGATRLAPLPPGFGDSVLEVLQEWEQEMEHTTDKDQRGRAAKKEMATGKNHSPSQQQRGASSLAFAHIPTGSRPQTATVRSSPTSPLHQQQQQQSQPSPANAPSFHPSPIDTTAAAAAASFPPAATPAYMSPASSPLASLGEALVHEDPVDHHTGGGDGADDISEDEWDRVDTMESAKPPTRPRTAGVRIPSAHTPASPQAATHASGSATARPSTSGSVRPTIQLPSEPSPMRADHEGYFGRPGDDQAAAESIATAPSTRPASSATARTPRTFMRITGASEDTHPAAAGVTHEISYISENLLRDSYHHAARGSILERRAIEVGGLGNDGEEKESMPGASGVQPAGASVYVKVGDAALRSSPAGKVHAPKGVALPATAASSPPLAAHPAVAPVKRHTAYVASKPLAAPTARPASPVLSFFGSPFDVRAIVEASKDDVAEAQARAIILGVQHGPHTGVPKVIREVTLAPRAHEEAEDQMSIASSVSVPEQTLLEYRASRRPPNMHPPAPIDATESAQQQATSFAETGEFHVEESPASSTSSQSPVDSPERERSLAHHESYSLAEALASPTSTDHPGAPHTAPAAAAGSKRPQSAFIRRTSGSTIVISGKQMSVRPSSAMVGPHGSSGSPVSDSGSNDTSGHHSTVQSRPMSPLRGHGQPPVTEEGTDREPAETNDVADQMESSEGHHQQHGSFPADEADDGLRFDETIPVTLASTSSAIVPRLFSSSSASKLFNFESAQALPPITARQQAQEPLAFSTFIGSTDARTQLPSALGGGGGGGASGAAIVQIPPGHPLSFNRPMSAMELTNEGVDLLNRVCALDTCGNKLYAVSGLGYQLIKCVWCRAVIYCSTGCMVEDWMRGVHPIVCAEAQAVAKQRAEELDAQSARRVDQVDGWMQVTAAPRSTSRPQSAVRARSRPRSPTRGVASMEEPTSPYHEQIQQQHQHQQDDSAFDSMLDFQELGADDIPYTGGATGYERYDENGYYAGPSEYADAELLRAQKDAEAAEVAESPHSLHAAMHELSMFPPQPALKLATRAKNHRPTSARVPTVKDIVLSGEEYATFTPGQVVVLPSKKTSEAYQLETQRAYAVLYDELRAGDQERADIGTNSRHTARPTSAKIARPPFSAAASAAAAGGGAAAHTPNAQPQDASKLLSRFHARLSTALTPSQQVAAGVSPHGANVLAKATPYQISAVGKRSAGGAGLVGIKTGGGGVLTSQALAPSIALGVEPSTIHYLPLARNTQLYAKTRGWQVRPQSAHTRTGPNGMAQSVSLTAAAAGGQRTVSGAFSKNFVAPKHFGTGVLDQFMHSGLYSTRGVDIATLRPPQAVIPQVDLRRAIAAARPTSARLASNGRMAVPQ